MNKVHYMSYRRLGGHRYKPTDVFCQMCQLRGYGNRLENSMPGGNIVTDAKILQLIWNIFPKEIQNWLTNDQKIDPFNPNNPLDADKFCNDLHCYWSIHFKNEKVIKDKKRTRERIRLNRTVRRSLATTIVEAVLAVTRRRRAVVVHKVATVATAVATTEETMVIGVVVLSSVTRTIVTTDGAVISIPTADVMTRRPCNVSTRTTRMASTYGTGVFTNWPADSLTRSPLGLAVVKAVE